MAYPPRLIDLLLASADARNQHGAIDIVVGQYVALYVLYPVVDDAALAVDTTNNTGASWPDIEYGNWM